MEQLHYSSFRWILASRWPQPASQEGRINLFLKSSLSHCYFKLNTFFPHCLYSEYWHFWITRVRVTLKSRNSIFFVSNHGSVILRLVSNIDSYSIRKLFWENINMDICCSKMLKIVKTRFAISVSTRGIEGHYQKVVKDSQMNLW